MFWGQHYMTPPYAAPPYTEGDVYRTVSVYRSGGLFGSLQIPSSARVRDEKLNYLRVLLCWGVGPVQVDNIRIGTSPLSSFNPDEYDIEHDLTGTKTNMILYPSQVRQDDINTELDPTFHVVTTAPETNEFSITLSFPRGLYRTERDARSSKEHRMDIEGQYRLKTSDDSEAWRPWFDEEVKRNQRQLFFLTRRKENLIAGTYEIRVRRKNAVSDNRTHFDKCIWLNYKSFDSTKEPVIAPGIAKTAIRFEASDDFSGALDQINAVVSLLMPTWNRAQNSWNTNQEVTKNPAAIFRYVLTGTANPNPLDLSSVDNAGLGEWHNYCEDEGLEYSKIVNSEQSVFDLLGEISAAGLARPHLSSDGKWGVVIDKPQTDSVALITPRNSWDFQGNVITDRIPHGLRIQYINSEKDPWEQDEVVVYADGYNIDGSEGKTEATYFENLSFPGVVNREQAERMGIRGVRVLWQRREGFSVTMDFEQLTIEKGDKVKFQHDVALVGQTSGRIKNLEDSNTVKLITLDEFVTFEERKLYAIDVRKDDGTISIIRATSPVGSFQTFSIPIGDSTGIKVGDLVAFGELQTNTIECLVNSIEPHEDLTATVSMVPYSGEIYTDPISLAPYEPIVSRPVSLTITGPLTPKIVQIVSDERALPEDSHGITLPAMRIYLETGISNQVNSNLNTADLFEVRWRSNEGENFQYATSPATQEFIQINNVRAKTEYQIGVRALDRNRGYSNWAVENHIVTGLEAPPNAVDFLRVANIGEQAYLRWAYTNPSRDAVSYTIRYHADTNVSNWNRMFTLAQAIPITENQFTLPTRNGTYAIKSVDSSGSESAEAKFANATLLNSLNEVTFHTLNESPNFSGTLSNMVKGTNNIKLNLINNNLVMDDWPVLDDLGALGGSVYESEGTYTTSVLDLTGIADARISANINISGGESAASDIASWEDLAAIESLADPIDPTWIVVPQYRTRNRTADNWSDWIDFSLADVTSRYFQFRVHVTGPPSRNATPVIDRTIFSVNLRRRTESDTNVATTTNGVLINYTNSYIRVPSLVITMLNAGSTDYYTITNKTKSGFRITAYNSSDTAIDKRFDWTANGI